MKYLVLFLSLGNYCIAHEQTLRLIEEQKKATHEFIEQIYNACELKESLDTKFKSNKSPELAAKGAKHLWKAQLKLIELLKEEVEIKEKIAQVESLQLTSRLSELRTALPKTQLVQSESKTFLKLPLLPIPKSQEQQ